MHSLLIRLHLPVYAHLLQCPPVHVQRGHSKLYLNVGVSPAQIPVLKLPPKVVVLGGGAVGRDGVPKVEPHVSALIKETLESSLVPSTR